MTAGVQRGASIAGCSGIRRYGSAPGNRTVVAPGRAYPYQSTGNAGMATAGSGDVLTGVIAGLIAQGVSAADAAVAGAYLHGMAGDKAAGETGMHGMLAGDILGRLPYVIKELVM